MRYKYITIHLLMFLRHELSVNISTDSNIFIIIIFKSCKEYLYFVFGIRIRILLKNMFKIHF